MTDKFKGWYPDYICGTQQAHAIRHAAAETVHAEHHQRDRGQHNDQRDRTATTVHRPSLRADDALARLLPRTGSRLTGGLSGHAVQSTSGTLSKLADRGVFGDKPLYLRVLRAHLLG